MATKPRQGKSSRRMKLGGAGSGPTASLTGSRPVKYPFVKTKVKGRSVGSSERKVKLPFTRSRDG